MVWWQILRTFFPGSAAKGRMDLLHEGSNTSSFLLSLPSFGEVLSLGLQSHVRQTVDAKDLNV